MARSSFQLLPHMGIHGQPSTKKIVLRPHVFLSPIPVCLGICRFLS